MVSHGSIRLPAVRAFCSLLIHDTRLLFIDKWALGGGKLIVIPRTEHGRTHGCVPIQTESRFVAPFWPSNREFSLFFAFAQDSGLYIIFNCNSGVVSNQFKSFLSQFILEQFNTDVYITEHSANDYLLNVIANEKTEYRISLSSIFTDVSDEILRSVCANASYIVTEKQLQGDSCKVCYLKSGAVITDTGIKLYDKNHQPCCISIGCRREE